MQGNNSGQQAARLGYKGGGRLKKLEVAFVSPLPSNKIKTLWT